MIEELIKTIREYIAWKEDICPNIHTFPRSPSLARGKIGETLGEQGRTLEVGPVDRLEVLFIRERVEDGEEVATSSAFGTLEDEAEQE